MKVIRHFQEEEEEEEEEEETKLRVRFFGKIQIRILLSKNGFCASLPKSENGLINQIKSKSGFLGFIIQAFLWGTDPKIVHLSSGLPCKFTGLAIFSLDLA